MTHLDWQTPYWPQGVSRTVKDYKFPLFHLLDRSAQKYPDNVFTLFAGATKTYAQVKDTADRVANFLANQGIKKGDKVAIFLPNLPHFPEILFGILKAGATAVNCNPTYTAPELNHQLNDSESKIVFCMDHPEFYKNTVTAVKGTGVETVVVCNIKSYLPRLKGFIGGILGKIPGADRIEPGHLRFDDVVANALPVPPEVSIDPENDTAIMLYTGGTTGLPKGAELVHTNFTYNVLASLEWCRLVQEPGGQPETLREGDAHCILGVLPWYHSFGLTGAMLVACTLGARIVCIPDPRAGNPPFTEVLQSVQKYKTTFMSAVPTIFVAFANHPHLKKYDLSSFMGCISGGAPLPPDVCREFEDKTGAIIFEAYGLTETAPALTANPTFTETRKIGSIGFPLPETDVKILNINDPTQEMPRGEDGELAGCGPQVMKGYWKRPDANETSFVEIDGCRYFLTGDIGHIDEDGYVVITDRKKDMILVGGFNVYPRDVEDILFTHPKVELVAVIGIPHEKSGEQVKAFLKLKEGETATQEEIMAFCREHMAGYKRPRQIEFRDEIPMSNVGKILRRVLRDEELNN
ncbi:FadD6 [Desulforapulum autotrophicum HRM2]|uniref:FadD6 n=1 Tax=Desulforapulum autotrophicum (strain ATCC 43914 / DSM 3382 / VKM B-1955 / HRM2) TaxID=177437 RepID=C0QDH4_DESAH|nr:long-chain fatty acid--CoA ligase [Desulforapulum autotrophicum]ACN15238.1 FadD6 [Desulforapulum autotrophicum HRM2]